MEIVKGEVKMEQNNFANQEIASRGGLRSVQTYEENLKVGNSGHWSEKEKARYYAFLEKFEDKFNEKLSRRQCKVFKAMASFIKTRDPNQCRSHHHKMTKNFNSIRETLEFLSAKNEFLKKRSEKFVFELDRININAKEEAAFSESVEVEIPNRKAEIFNFCSNETYFDPINMPKLLDIGNLRTDITDNGMEVPLIDYQQSSYNIPTTSFKGFPSTGLLPTTMTTISNCPPAYMDCSSFIPEAYNIAYMNQQTDREQKWQECHEYFIKWVNKLHTLMGESCQMQNM